VGFSPSTLFVLRAFANATQLHQIFDYARPIYLYYQQPRNVQARDNETLTGAPPTVTVGGFCLLTLIWSGTPFHRLPFVTISEKVVVSTDVLTKSLQNDAYRVPPDLCALPYIRYDTRIAPNQHEKGVPTRVRPPLSAVSQNDWRVHTFSYFLIFASM